MCIYRAKEGAEIGSFRNISDPGTRRPPGNVPYVVDNLWEWTRPDEFPDRRKSKFASPTPEQALRSAGLLADCLESADMSEDELEKEGLPDECLEHVFWVEFVGDPIIAQLSDWEDAKHHPDCDDLRSVLFNKLGNRFTWSSKERLEKRPVSELFQPCLTAEEVETILDESDEIQPSDKDDLRDAVGYWDDLKLIGPENLANEQKGEILFEFRNPDDGDGYWRRPAEDGC